MNSKTENDERLTKALFESFKTVYDPEFGVSVVDLGIVYSVDVTQGYARIVMTLTSMYCPAGDVILSGMKSAAERVPGIDEARVDLVWDPVWTPERLSVSAREYLGWDQPRVNA
jgi:metal-sulfur cluster biosynthetic enzyme